MFDTIIIGGGAAGLMASAILSEGGQKIALLEAKGRLGGRIQMAENLSFPAEGGAEFIHGTLPATMALLKEAGLRKSELRGEFCRVTGGKWSSDNMSFPHQAELVKRLAACNENISVADFLDTYFSAGKYDSLRRQFAKYVEGYDAADINFAAILPVKKEMEAGFDAQYRPNPGYPAIIDHLATKSLKNNGVIKTGEPVSKITGKSIITVVTPRERYTTRKVILAVPLGVLQTRKGHKNHIDLPAYLEAYSKAAGKIGNGGAIKILLEFDAAFWLDKKFLQDRKVPAPSYIFSDNVIPTWWTQYPSKWPLLTGWIAGPASLAMKKYSHKRITKLAMESLASLFSLPLETLDTRLQHAAVMNWNREPYILGGYSYAGVDTGEARKILQKPFNNSIYFSGEYVPDDSSSTVEAALASGREVARQILGKL